MFIHAIIYNMIRYIWGPIIHFFDGRSPSKHINRVNLAGLLIEHFLEGIALLRHWHINPNMRRVT